MQVKDCLKQNDELRSMLHKLRMEQAGRTSMSDNMGLPEFSKDETAPVTVSPEIISLKVSTPVRIIFSHL